MSRGSLKLSATYWGSHTATPSTGQNAMTDALSDAQGDANVSQAYKDLCVKAKKIWDTVPEGDDEEARASNRKAWDEYYKAWDVYKQEKRNTPLTHDS